MNTSNKTTFLQDWHMYVCMYKYKILFEIVTFCFHKRPQSGHWSIAPHSFSYYWRRCSNAGAESWWKIQCSLSKIVFPYCFTTPTKTPALTLILQKWKAVTPLQNLYGDPGVTLLPLQVWKNVDALIYFLHTGI